MPIRIEILIEIVIWLIIGLFSVTVGLVLITIQRRARRSRFFVELDLARRQARAVVDPLYRKEGNPESVIASFKAFRSQTFRFRAKRQALEEALFSHTQDPEELALTREIFQKMGWISEWVGQLRCRAKEASGQAARLLAEVGDSYRPPTGMQRIQLRLRAGFMTRSIAANKLARVPTPEGACALVAGIADPHPDVQEICVRHLGNLADRRMLPVLLEELVKVLEGRSGLSVRNLKTALVLFSLEEADGFMPVLEGTNRRARFFAVDILREIADRHAANHGPLNKSDFSPALYHLFTERLYQDEWGDVRARAALVIAHFHDPDSHEILEKLLQDDAWFVRLHACRAAADKFFLPIAPALDLCLADSHWLVREAAVGSLMAMGNEGTAQVIHSFLTLEDRFATEQIAEELQRSRLLITLLDTIGEPGQPDNIILVVRKMISLGKISMLLAYLMSGVPSTRKQVLIEELSACDAPDCWQVLKTCAEDDPDPEVRDAARNALETLLAR